jgi:hypothetical protein
LPTPAAERDARIATLSEAVEPEARIAALSEAEAEDELMKRLRVL